MGGAKRSNIIKFQIQSQFQIFLNLTLSVFSHMKDIKHVRRDFIPSPGSCHRGGTWVVQGGWGSKIVVVFSSKIQANLVCELLT